MQISTPTQAQSPVQESSYLRESSFGENQSGWSHKVQKKNPGGFFAKLLEGLTAKIKTDNPKGALGPGKLKEAEGEILPQNMVKNAQKAGQNSKNPKNSGISFRDESASGAESFILWQNILSIEQKAEQNPGLKAGSENFRSVRKDNRAGSLAPGDFRLEANLKEEGLATGTDKGEGQKNSAFTALLSRPEKGERTASPGLTGQEKQKSAARAEGAFRGASAGNNEAASFQVQVKNDFTSQMKPERSERDNSLSLKNQGKKSRERLNIEARSDRLQAEGQDAVKPELLNAKSADAVKRTEVELPVNLSLKAEKGEEAAGKTGSDLSKGSNFEDALAKELQGKLSTDIVREAAVIVRGAGEGTIRLSLRPASLGDVKIRLEMAENKITGHIILQSSEALRAFERELPVLEKAFKDSGFSETNLEMSLAQDGGEYGANEQGQDGDFKALSPMFAASRYEAESDWIEEPSALGDAIFSASHGRKAVNLLV